MLRMTLGNESPMMPPVDSVSGEGVMRIDCAANPADTRCPGGWQYAYGMSPSIWKGIAAGGLLAVVITTGIVLKKRARK